MPKEFHSSWLDSDSDNIDIFLRRPKQIVGGKPQEDQDRRPVNTSGTHCWAIGPSIQQNMVHLSHVD